MKSEAHLTNSIQIFPNRSRCISLSRLQPQGFLPRKHLGRQSFDYHKKYSRVTYHASFSIQKAIAHITIHHIYHISSVFIKNSRWRMTSTFSLVLQKPTIDFIHLLSTSLNISISLIYCPLLLTVIFNVKYLQDRLYTSLSS